MNVAIDKLQSADWEIVRSIYLDGIATGHATFETAVPDWERWDSVHLSFARLVARNSGDVVGWAALSPVSSRRVYTGVAEVSVYVATAARRLGVGRSLLVALIEEAEHLDPASRDISGKHRQHRVAQEVRLSRSWPARKARNASRRLARCGPARKKKPYSRDRLAFLKRSPPLDALLLIPGHTPGLQ